MLQQNDNQLARLHPSPSCEAVGCHSIIPSLSVCQHSLSYSQRKSPFLFVEGEVKQVFAVSIRLVNGEKVRRGGGIKISAPQFELCFLPCTCKESVLLKAKLNI